MLTLVVLLVCAQGLHSNDSPVIRNSQHRRSISALAEASRPAGCEHAGRWHRAGAAVEAGGACLRCACGRGALACRRRACQPLPEPPPPRCHVLHRRDRCCPELHCPDGITVMEQSAAARAQDDDFEDIVTSASVLHACVEGGTVFAAGSALRAGAACEQCFCLGGARRCVRPRCLPPPAGCTPRPAPGACCPQRYYCTHLATEPPDERRALDCEVSGALIAEGERVLSAEAGAECSQCFCLRGRVRCQPLACAPTLHGCRPLLRPGECCPHQYHCEHNQLELMRPSSTVSDNGLVSTRNDDRVFHSPKAYKLEITTKNTLSNIFTAKNTPTVSAASNHLIATTKVKRRTVDLPIVNASNTTSDNTTSAKKETSQKPTFASKRLVTTDVAPTTEAGITSTEQPDGTIRIMINGTINCTAELSTSPLNATLNDTERITLEAQPRIPIVNIDSFETHTSYPNDIITDRSVSGDFDENETFTINVTSSLSTNASHSTAKAPVPSVTSIAMPNAPAATNSSKKVKGDYDYDYAEPTLPPSLPNLKIIPFVAADAVVDEIPPKDTLSYPILEREDKFPIYYPSGDPKKTVPYATRREDIYNPTQYPVFDSEKQSSQYPSLADEIDLTNTGYSSIHDSMDAMHDYTVSTSIGSQIPEINKTVTRLPPTSSTSALEMPSLNLFSPPVETEGGFIPKGPGVDEFYTVYSSTSAPPAPRLTTSMQLGVAKGGCQTSDGRRVLEGATISLACSECTCAWSELNCAPRPCLTPPGCKRKPASSNSADLCCGELICVQENKTTVEPINKILENTDNTRLEVESPTNKSHTNYVPIQNDTHANSPLSNNKEAEKAIYKTNTSIINHNVTENSENITTVLSTTASPTEQPTTGSVFGNTTPTSNLKEVNETNDNSSEYEDEEEDEGFSFGSVLKLLLSDNYETTTNSQYKKQTKPAPAATTTRRPPQPPSVMPFVPLPHRPYAPPNKVAAQNTVNRIDHLVLGEATAIRKTTPKPKPITTSFKPIMTFKPMPSFVNQAPTKSPPTTKKEEPIAISQEPSFASALPGVGPGLLKLAGCNIYGTMYRVGRIIAELSTPCEECWCTELGIQCKRLAC